MKFILGKKLEMTQVWLSDEVKAVTRVVAGPCRVVQVKTGEKDGYRAVQIGFGERKEKNIKKPQKNHLKGLGNLRYLREFRIKDAGEANIGRGDTIDVSIFAPGDTIEVTGTSKGKGFQGVVKRHGFHGHNATHGTKDQVRMSGSIGAGGPLHVFKGTRMGGRMGGDRVTVKNLKIVEVDLPNNIIAIEGAVPGARNGLLMIQGDGELKVKRPEAPVAAVKEADRKTEIKDIPEQVEKEVVQAKEKVDEKKKTENT